MPLYKRILENVRKEIHEGKYKVGDMLPSENDYSKQYSTTRATVRLALTELTNLGYINRIQGKGSIVIEPRNSLGILSVKGVTTGVGRKNLNSQMLVNPIKTIWPEDFYYDLTDREKRSGCIFLSRIRFVNRVPIIYEETHIVNNNQFTELLNYDLEDKSLFQTLKDLNGIEIIRGEQRIWAIVAGKKIGSLLKIKVNSPVAHLKRKLITNIKHINIYSNLFCTTDKYYLQDYF